MSSKVSYRRHSPEFKLQLCREIRAGELRRVEAQRQYKLSAALVHSWLTQFDQGDMDPETVRGQIRWSSPSTRPRSRSWSARLASSRWNWT